MPIRAVHPSLALTLARAASGTYDSGDMDLISDPPHSALRRLMRSLLPCCLSLSTGESIDIYRLTPRRAALAVPGFVAGPVRDVVGVEGLACCCDRLTLLGLPAKRFSAKALKSSGCKLRCFASGWWLCRWAWRKAKLASATSELCRNFDRQAL